MKITGLFSICCGESVKLLPPSQRSKENGDAFYRCLKCKKPAEAYFSTLMNEAEIAYLSSLSQEGK